MVNEKINDGCCLNCSHLLWIEDGCALCDVTDDLKVDEYNPIGNLLCEDWSYEDVDMEIMNDIQGSER